MNQYRKMCYGAGLEMVKSDRIEVKKSGEEVEGRKIKTAFEKGSPADYSVGLGGGEAVVTWLTLVTNKLL